MDDNAFGEELLQAAHAEVIKPLTPVKIEKIEDKVSKEKVYICDANVDVGIEQNVFDPAVLQDTQTETSS